MKYSMQALAIVLMGAAGALLVAQESRGQTAEACEAGFESFKKTVYPFVRERCAECHDSDGPGPSHSVKNEATAYMRISRYVNWDDLKSSAFYKIGGNKHCVDNGVDCKTGFADVEKVLQEWFEGGENKCEHKGRYFTQPQAMPSNLPMASTGEYARLRFDLTGVHPALEGSVFEVEAQRFSELTPTTAGSYRFRKPRLGLAKGSVRLRDIKVLINDKFDTVTNAFTLVDAKINGVALPANRATPLPHPVLSPSNMIVMQDKPMGDMVSISFEEITPLEEPVACRAVEVFKADVLPLLDSRACYSCHSGGADMLAGRDPARQRLNMARGDEALCSQLVQRSNLENPGVSPMIGYPIRGLNGHPRRLMRAEEEASVLKWLEAEKPQE